MALKIFGCDFSSGLSTARNSSMRRTPRGVSWPWSWTAVRPASSTICQTRSKSSSTKTPTFSTAAGSRAMMARASAGAMRRGLSAKTKPSASAPAVTATSASSRFVVPQIFTHVIVAPKLAAPKNLTRLSGRVGEGRKPLVFRPGFPRIHADRPDDRRLGLRQHLQQRFAGRLSAHERFADEERLIARLPQRTQLRAGRDAALGNAHHIMRHRLDEAMQDVEVRLEGAQVAAVHADDVGAEVECPLEFGLVVHLAEHVELSDARFLHQQAQLRVRQRRGK